ncbi:hypothetical protein D3C78_1633220 [compost metagenome]
MVAASSNFRRAGWIPMRLAYSGFTVSVVIWLASWAPAESPARTMRLVSTLSSAACALIYARASLMSRTAVGYVASGAIG